MESICRDVVYFPPPLTVFVFAGGEEIMVHEELLRRHKCLQRKLPNKAPSPTRKTKIRVPCDYGSGGWLLIHWLFRGGLKHDYAVKDLPLTLQEDLVQAYVMAKQLGIEELAHEITDICEEILFPRLTCPMLGTIAHQLADKQLLNSGLMALTLSEGQSIGLRLRDPTLAISCGEKQDAHGVKGDSVASQRAADWVDKIQTSRPMDYGPCPWHDHDHTPRCSSKVDLRQEICGFEVEVDRLPKETLLRMYTSPIVRLVVGPEEVVIWVHKEVLQRCKFFAMCLGPDAFKEGTDNAVTFPEDQPSMIGLVVAFLYLDRLPSAFVQLWTTPLRKKSLKSIIGRLIDLYIIADRLLIEELGNYVVTILQNLETKFRVTWSHIDKLSAGDDTIYPLKGFLLKKMARDYRANIRRGGQEFDDSLRRQLHDRDGWAEFTRYLEGEGEDDDGARENPCRWHKHTSTAPCESSDWRKRG